MSEMSQASIGSHINVIVAADWDASKQVGGNGATSPWEPAANGAAYPTGTEWYRIRGGGLVPYRFAISAEQNLDANAYLQAATDYAFQNYPAQRYAVILWDHGGSWSGGFGGDQQDGTAAGSGMTAAGAASAIGNALLARGLTGPRPLEFLAFDTCLMACPEVIQPFSAMAKTYIACAEIDFGAGWDYTATLGHISANSTAAATAIAAQEVAFWNAHHASSATDLVAKSHIAIDLTRWDAFATAMGQLVAAIDASATMTALDWGTRHFTTAPGYSFDAEQARTQPNLRDIGQLLTKLGTLSSDLTVKARADTAAAALTGMRLGLSQGTLRSINSQSGLHIECAIASKYTATPARLTSYATKAAAWNAASNWSDLLTLVQGADDTTQPILTVSSSGGAVVTIDFSTANADIGEASVWLTRTNPDTTIDDFGLIAGDIITPGAYQFTWDLEVPTLSDGTTTTYARAERVIIGDGIANSLFGFSCAYTVGSDTIDGFVVFGPNDTYTALFIELDTSGGVNVHPLYPGGTITPRIDRYSGGPTPTPIAMAPLTVPTSRQLTIAMTAAPTGNYRLLVAGMDVWGNEATVWTVPYAITAR